MRVPQALDELAVVIALVGAQVFAALQQRAVALLELIHQPQRRRLLGGRGLGDLERHRQLVGGVHHQVHQEAEPRVLLPVPVRVLRAAALDAPISILFTPPVGVLLAVIVLGVRDRIVRLRV